MVAPFGENNPEWAGPAGYYVLAGRNISIFADPDTGAVRQGLSDWPHPRHRGWVRE